MIRDEPGSLPVEGAAPAAAAAMEPLGLSTWAILPDEAFAVAGHDDLTYTAVPGLPGADPICTDAAALARAPRLTRLRPEAMPPSAMPQSALTADATGPWAGRLLLAVSILEGPLALGRRAGRYLRRLGAPGTLGIAPQD